MMNRIAFFLTLLCCFSAAPRAESIQTIDINEYTRKVQSLNSACQKTQMFPFSGFCLSEEYGKPAYDNPTQTSINLGVEIASLDLFLRSCEHSDSVRTADAISKAKDVLEAKKFFDEASSQREALQNYVERFYFCKSRSENDATIANRLKWLSYMTNKYSRAAAGEQSIRLATSSKSAKSIVECILAHYRGAFFADGVMDQDGSIVVSLFAPMTQPLAKVKNMGNGSVTQYVNTDIERFKSIPAAADFSNAVVNCQ